MGSLIGEINTYSRRFDWQVAVTRMLAVHNEVSEAYGLHECAGSEKIRLYTGSHNGTRVFFAGGHGWGWFVYGQP